MTQLSSRWKLTQGTGFELPQPRMINTRLSPSHEESLLVKLSNALQVLFCVLSNHGIISEKSWKVKSLSWRVQDQPPLKKKLRLLARRSDRIWSWSFALGRARCSAHKVFCILISRLIPTHPHPPTGLLLLLVVFALYCLGCVFFTDRVEV